VPQGIARVCADSLFEAVLIGPFEGSRWRGGCGGQWDFHGDGLGSAGGYPVDTSKGQLLLLFYRLLYAPSERGKRASSSGVELFGTEQPGAAMYLVPAWALASFHCVRISVVVNFS
jgi:hypothetical protein